MPQSRRRALSPIRLIVLAAIVVAVAATALVLFRFSRPGVTVAEIVEDEAVQAFYATGTLEPADREYPRRAGVEGFIQNPVKGSPYLMKGSRVTKGQVLAIVFDENLQHAYDRAAADAVEKRARADEKASPVLQEFDAKISAFGELVQAATREFNRYSAGVESGAANQADFDRSLDRLKTVWSEWESFKAQKSQMQLKLQRELAEAESTLKIATWNLEQMKVVSPVDGYVLDTPQQVGVHVGLNDLVVTVANTGARNLVMRAQVDEEDVTKVWEPTFREHVSAVLGPMFGLDRLFTGVESPRQPVLMSLYSFPDPFVGRVVKIYPKADPERRTFEVDIAIDKPSDRMQAGMTGELMFVTRYKPKAAVAPAQALQGGRFWVVRDGALQPADATAGLRDVQRVEVAKGLRAGDRVIISPVADLTPGQSVRVAEVMDPTAAANLNKPKMKDIFRGGF